jgi:hypothetical protein
MLTKKQLEDMANCANHGCDSCTAKDTVGGACQIASAQTALTYREMLERLEWVDNDYCPICWQYRANGHANDCELATLLNESEVEHDA